MVWPANVVSNRLWGPLPKKDCTRVRDLRAGSLNAYTSGPLGALLIQKLTDPVVGVVLDSYFDADGTPQGNAAVYIAR